VLIITLKSARAELLNRYEMFWRAWLYTAG